MDIKQCLNSWVVIKRDDQDAAMATTKSGIIVQNRDVRPKLFIGTVVNSKNYSPAYFNPSMEICDVLPEGTKVLYYSPAIRTYKVGEENVDFIRLEDIYATVEED